MAATNSYSEILAIDNSITNKDLEYIPSLFDILLPAYPNIAEELKRGKSMNGTTYTSKQKSLQFFKTNSNVF